ncbi:heme-binding protein [Roseateles sp. P5_D6]
MDSRLKAPQTAAQCAAQEAALVLERLTAADAMGIGQSILALAQQWFAARPVAIHLETDDHPLFVYFMDGTGAGNADWIIRKKNVVRRFGHSSWRVRLEFLERQANFHAETGLDPTLFQAEGGALPLAVHGKGRVGTLIVSGLDGWEDHALAAGGLALWSSQ